MYDNGISAHRRLWLPVVWAHASAVAGRGAIAARLVRVAALRVGAAEDGVEQVHLVRGAVRVVRVVRLRGNRQPDARVRPLHLVAHGVRRLRHAIPRAHPVVKSVWSVGRVCECGSPVA